MEPIGPLMIEHRLIERLIAQLQRELQRIRDNVAVEPEFAFVDPVFIDTAVDFMKTYADRGHHGKEEGILFAALASKDLAPDHRRVMEELVREHAWGRETTASLVKAKGEFLLGQGGAVEAIMKHMGELVEFYPRHIEKEDKHFFFPCLEYFSQPERDELLQRMWDFDRRLIHEKYRQVIEHLETHKCCKI